MRGKGGRGARRTLGKCWRLLFGIAIYDWLAMHTPWQAQYQGLIRTSSVTSHPSKPEGGQSPAPNNTAGGRKGGLRLAPLSLETAHPPANTVPCLPRPPGLQDMSHPMGWDTKGWKRSSWPCRAKDWTPVSSLPQQRGIVQLRPTPLSCL